MAISSGDYAVCVCASAFIQTIKTSSRPQWTDRRPVLLLIAVDQHILYRKTVVLTFSESVRHVKDVGKRPLSIYAAADFQALTTSQDPMYTLP